MLPKLSIIIPVVNPKKNLKKLFLSLQEFGEHDSEILVINQSMKKLDDDIRKAVKIVIVERLTKNIIPASSARNLGATIATGKYLFFLDDDCLVNMRCSDHKRLFELFEKDIEQG